MVGNVVIKDVQIRFSNKFLFPEVVEEFKRYFSQESTVYLNMVDYINHTIIDSDVLGYDAPTTSEQYTRKGDVKSAVGSLRKSRKHPRTISITLSVKQSMMNYMILLRNCDVFDESRDMGKRAYYEEIYLDVYDHNGDVIYTWVYSEVQVTKMSSIRIAKTDKGIGNKTFTIDLTFNNFTFVNRLADVETVDLSESYNYGKA